MIEKEIFGGLGLLSSIMAICMLLVLVAIIVDLVSGWRKAKIRGEARTSYGFSRTFTKVLQREGLLIVAWCIDVAVHFAWWFFATETVYCVPIVGLLFTVAICGVEAWSVKEKADEKDKNRLDHALKIIIGAIGKDKAAELITETLKKGEAHENTKKGQ